MEDDVRSGARHDIDQFRRPEIGPNQSEQLAALTVATKCRSEIGLVAGPEVVHADHLVAVCQQSVDEVGPDRSRQRR